MTARAFRMLGAREEAIQNAGVTYGLLAGQAVPDELTAFLDAEWAAWHAAQGHDLTADWSGTSFALVARDEAGRIVGAARGRARAGVGHLSELMTAAHMRGQGIGSELVRRFEDYCWSLGCHKLTVHTDHAGPAHGFYLRHGWQEEALLRHDRGGRDFVRLCRFKVDACDS